MVLLIRMSAVVFRCMSAYVCDEFCLSLEGVGGGGGSNGTWFGPKCWIGDVIVCSAAYLDHVSDYNY